MTPRRDRVLASGRLFVLRGRALVQALELVATVVSIVAVNRHLRKLAKNDGQQRQTAQSADTSAD